MSEAKTNCGGKLRSMGRKDISGCRHFLGWRGLCTVGQVFCPAKEPVLSLGGLIEE